MNSIYKAFHQFFEIIIADTPKLMREVYHLRYLVLCIQNSYPGVNASDYPDKLEQDEYDYRSLHILLKHRPSDTYIGTVRLILQDAKDPSQPFPIEVHTQIDTELIDLNKLPRQHMAEISRFVILKQFSGRRLRNSVFEGYSNSKYKVYAERRCFPHTGLALVVGIVQMCAAHNIHYWLSAMDPCLNRLLSFYGSNLSPVGPFTEYHGLRRPYFIKLIEVLKRMYLYHHDIWELVTDFGKSCPYSMSYAQARMPAQPSWQGMSKSVYVHR